MWAFLPEWDKGKMKFSIVPRMGHAKTSFGELPKEK